MFSREIALEALNALFGANIMFQNQGSQGELSGAYKEHQSLSISQFIPTLFKEGETSVSQSDKLGGAPHKVTRNETLTRKNLIINEDEFFDPDFDYDFTNEKDTETFSRGGEEYKRPCGWYRYALKVLDKFNDGNTWLGTTNRKTESEPGEWPVSYHGTSIQGAEGIIKGHYKPGTGQAHGRGIYSTPDINEAIVYVKEFSSKGKRFQVILQNRINREYREICKRNTKYWLIPIPDETSNEEVHDIVVNSIRPYGLLVKEVK